MQSEPTLQGMWRRFRAGEEHRPLFYLAVTLAAGCLLFGLGLGLSWLGPIVRSGRVRREDLGIGVGIGGAAFVVAVVWIWWPVVRLRRAALHPSNQDSWRVPLLFTAGLVGAATVASFTIQAQGPNLDDEGFAITAIWLIAGGLAIIGWLPVVLRLEHRRPVTGVGGAVNVVCPKCQHSMAGLRSLTCPECGEVYTLDELILAQGYA